MMRFLAAAAAALLVVAVVIALSGQAFGWASVGLALAAALAAAFGATIMPAPPAPAPVEAAPVPVEPEAAPIPVGTLLDAFDAPVLLVERQRVVIANAAARAALGTHIVGEDVRLAIRHPAASDRLIGREGDANERHEVDLAGVGTPERRWRLAIHPLGDERRLVRLVDRTSVVAAEQMRVDFVANASHELRTPLSTLIGFIETLEDGPAGEDAPTRARFLKIMAAEAVRMQRLVDDLISLSRIEADRFSPPSGEVALAQLMLEVRRTTVSGLGEDAGRIVSAVADDLPPAIGDAAQLTQLLHNLVSNAIKYARPGTPVTVSLALDRGGMLRLSVADQGEGIAPEHLPRLTERFYRVDPGRSRAGGGTGLGLAIVKYIVERHRGRLEINSVPGTGTTVTVLLPAAPRPVPPAAGVTPGASVAPAAPVIKV